MRSTLKILIFTPELLGESKETGTSISKFGGSRGFGFSSGFGRGNNSPK